MQKYRFRKNVQLNHLATIDEEHKEINEVKIHFLILDRESSQLNLIYEIKIKSSLIERELNIATLVLF